MEGGGRLLQATAGFVAQRADKSGGFNEGPPHERIKGRGVGRAEFVGDSGRRIPVGDLSEAWGRRKTEGREGLFPLGLWHETAAACAVSFKERIKRAGGRAREADLSVALRRMEETARVPCYDVLQFRRVKDLSVGPGHIKATPELVEEIRDRADGLELRSFRVGKITPEVEQRDRVVKEPRMLDLLLSAYLGKAMQIALMQIQIVGGYKKADSLALASRRCPDDRGRERSKPRQDVPKLQGLLALFHLVRGKAFETGRSGVFGGLTRLWRLRLLQRTSKSRARKESLKKACRRRRPVSAAVVTPLVKTYGDGECEWH